MARDSRGPGRGNRATAENGTPTRPYASARSGDGASDVDFQPGIPGENVIRPGAGPVLYRPRASRRSA